MNILEKEYDGVMFSTDKKKLNVNYIHQFLSNSYWAKHIPVSTVKKSIDNSVCIGIYLGTEDQIGFARLVTDEATVAWLADVFVDDRYRGKGVSKRLMEFVMAFDFIPDLRRIMLATRDAHGLYEQSGFGPVASPDKLMEILHIDMYSKKKTA